MSMHGLWIYLKILARSLWPCLSASWHALSPCEFNFREASSELGSSIRVSAIFENPCFAAQCINVGISGSENNVKMTFVVLDNLLCNILVWPTPSLKMEGEIQSTQYSSRDMNDACLTSNHILLVLCRSKLVLLRVCSEQWATVKLGNTIWRGRLSAVDTFIGRQLVL